MIRKLNTRKEILEFGIVKETYDLFDEGSCQCFSDCDCYKNRGIIQRNIITYDKKPSLEEAISLKEQQAKSKIIHVERLLKVNTWKNEIGQKEFNKIVSDFKLHDKSLKRFNHKEIWDNDNYTLTVYNYHIKNNTDKD